MKPITPEKVAEVKSLLETGMALHPLAEKAGVSYGTVRRIRDGQCTGAPRDTSKLARKVSQEDMAKIRQMLREGEASVVDLAEDWGLSCGYLLQIKREELGESEPRTQASRSSADADGRASPETILKRSRILELNALSDAIRPDLRLDAFKYQDRGLSWGENYQYSDDELARKTVSRWGEYDIRVARHPLRGKYA